MSAPRLASYEFRRQKHPLQKLSVGFLVLLPLLYGALYLWSAWDPYGRLDKLPVAVVDLDQPVTVDGRTVDAGRRFTDELRDDSLFDWRFTDADSASTGLADGRYLIVITIPSTFSADLTSASSGTPRQAQIDMRVDDSNGYLVNVIAKTAQAELAQRVDRTATTAYFEVVYQRLDQLSRGLTRASNGSARLEAGLQRGSAGTTKLVAGLTELDAGAGRAVSGLTRLQAGAEKVADGNERIAEVAVPVLDDVSTALPRLATRTTTLTSDAATLTRQVSDGANDLADRQADVERALDDLAATNPGLADDPAYEALTGASATLGRGIDDAATTTEAISTGATRIDRTAQRVADDVPDLQRELRRGANDVTRLADGSRRVANGAARLRSGVAEIDDGIGTALTGSKKLQRGTERLTTGSAKLNRGLDRLTGAVPDLSADQRRQNAEVLGSPADVVLTADNPARVYGRGLAPFFFSIALWVVGLAAFLILRPVNARALAVGGARSLTVSLAGWLPVMVVGVGGGLLLLSVVTVGLGLDPVHLLWSIGLVALAAACFTAIAQLLRMTWGIVGSAVLLVLLMVQLTSCGGLYPVQTLPEPLRWAHPVLPMTYLVDGLRITFTGGPTSRLWTDAAVLFGYGTAAVLLAWFVVHRRRRWTPARRDPALPE